MIITELKKCIQNNQKAILATIIDKKGSSYRQVGAKSLILLDGTTFGVLSGGCIEQDLFEHAKEVFETGEPKEVIYDLRNDDQTPWGLGVGCNGVITIWLTLINPIENRREAEKMLDVFTRQYVSNGAFTIGTVITSDNQELIQPGYILDTKEMDFVHNPMNKLNGILKNQILTIDEKALELTIFLETITPAPSIVIFGAGPDALSLTNQLKLLNWHVTMVDHRPGYLNEENFPNVDEMILVPPREFPNDLYLNNSYTVIMTHHYEQDLIFLKGLIQMEPAYIGLLGPKRRYENIKSDLLREGVLIPQNILDKIHTPIGLDIGSETPEEIALSIAAEIMSFKNKGSYQPLKWKRGSIHQPSLEYQNCKLKEFV
ncbi:XdhC/CoxI family protein [Bacillus sp. DTU_2020_1000418_1_SI_GHA_SEK_038]|uniref:XdhC family protein n=1 Tax=Bacillus sp. DTU_2020_1000418_1_SI_GHA_SEK_038 TaxID=3077585 RepID=UPI0028EFFFD0|nr:XdhC/CoxI family protein [Bacillus sp. DTU_2020_1000418_1_SI_GHA_SEK_038]WNS73650.1 XdhC/CoxI family protein [Bacillus sp. DTU_2020_1000418_1_SI_GHA_SEK_038]